MAMKTGLGHKDLDELVSNPSDLKFTIELLKVENPEDYDKEIWQMSAQELIDRTREDRDLRKYTYLTSLRFENLSNRYKL